MMSTQRRVSIRAVLLAISAAVVMFAIGPNAGATIVRIHFSAPAGSGYADLTLGNTNANDVVDTNHKPRTITGASGMFTASGASSGVAITGVLPTGHDTAPGEVLPYSYTLLSIPGVGDHNGVTYDNLYYPDGSPMICLVNGDPAFPFSGGFLDLMGVMFTLENDNLVDLWSFGVVDPAKHALPPFVSGLTYGVKVLQPDGDSFTVLPFAPFGTASVPEPDQLWLLGGAMLALLIWRRSVERRRASRTA